MIRTLSCHCGEIRLETNAELDEVTECNCSNCGRRGTLHWYVKPDQVRLARPRRGFSTYVWRFATEGLHFCPVCGVAMLATGPNYLSLNARCVDGVDVFELKIRRADNRNCIPGGDVPPLTDSGGSV